MEVLTASLLLVSVLLEAEMTVRIGSDLNKLYRLIPSRLATLVHVSVEWLCGMSKHLKSSD